VASNDFSTGITMEKLLPTLTASNRLPTEMFPPGLFEAQSLLCNNDPRNLVAPLREAKSALAREQVLSPQKVRELQIALLLQDEWEASLVHREFLKMTSNAEGNVFNRFGASLNRYELS
jgi:hypothetical protein